MAVAAAVVAAAVVVAAVVAVAVAAVVVAVAAVAVVAVVAVVALHVAGASAPGIEPAAQPPPLTQFPIHCAQCRCGNELTSRPSPLAFRVWIHSPLTFVPI